MPGRVSSSGPFQQGFQNSLPASVIAPIRCPQDSAICTPQGKPASSASKPAAVQGPAAATAAAAADAALPLPALPQQPECACGFGAEAEEDGMDVAVQPLVQCAGSGAALSPGASLLLGVGAAGPAPEAPAGAPEDGPAPMQQQPGSCTPGSEGPEQQQQQEQQHGSAVEAGAGLPGPASSLELLNKLRPLLEGAGVEAGLLSEFEVAFAQLPASVQCCLGRALPRAVDFGGRAAAEQMLRDALQA